MNNIIKSLRSSKTFLICTHVDPDGDAIGSASALCEILLKLGKKVKIYSPGIIPPVYRFIKHTDNTAAKIGKNERFDCIIAVDCGSIARIPFHEKLKDHTDILINIDHHSDNTLFGDINHVKTGSSTGELIYYLAKKLKVKITGVIASALYAAIITDTGCFKHNNTTRDVFLIAADLVKAGAEPNFIANEIYESRTEPEIKILGKALENIKTAKNGRLAWVSLSIKQIKGTGAKNEDLRQIVDFVRSVKGVEIAVFFREIDGGKTKINFRSKGKNVQMVAKALGGGGHMRASGAVVKGTLRSAANKVLSTIKKLWTAL
jgi:phosphoesterase RecJ-like protein